MIGEKGKSSQHISSLTSCVLSVLAMLLLLCHPTVSSESHHLSDDPDIFEQLSTGQQRAAELLEPSSSQDASRPNRLAQLLLMKNSLDKLLSPLPAESNRDDIGGDLDLENATDENGSDLGPPARKRVFCNGFTGCGGRFRAQRRQGLRNKDKRVFCNSQGCFNGGRKRAMAESQNEDASNVDMELWKKALRRLEEMKHWKELKEMRKRLFCNNYGGCQNQGKRRLSKGTNSRSSNAASLPERDFSSERPLHPQKRFFASGFDQQMDDLSASLSSDSTEEDESDRPGSE